MKHSQFISAVVVRDDTIVTAAFNTKVPEHIKVMKSNVSDMPYAAKVLVGITGLLDRIVHSNVKGRISVIVPETAYVRMLHAHKLIKNGEDVVAGMTFPWMYDEGYDIWEKTLHNFVVTYIRVLMNGVKINWVNSRLLAMWKIEGNVQDLKEGDLLVFKNGICEEYGITCKENPFLNGPKTVHVNDSDKYYVWRDIRTSYFGDTYGNGKYVLDARKLIKEAKKLLPVATAEIA